MGTRPSAVAGMFYPGEAKRLTETVEAYLAEGKTLPQARPAKAVIAPHAGYDYSGPIAGSAYACLGAQAKDIERVILVGPSHHVPFAGVAASRASAFQTPLGPAAVDRDAIDGLLKNGLIREMDAAHAHEHSLEVQLPFLQRVFPAAQVVPLLVGDHDYVRVAAILEILWGGSETVVVVSSDLSHFHDYQTACRLDHETAQSIEARLAGAVDFDRACGATPVNALLQVAASKGLAITTVDLRNSGDTAGSRDRVVGYGAFVVG